MPLEIPLNDEKTEKKTGNSTKNIAANLRLALQEADKQLADGTLTKEGYEQKIVEIEDGFLSTVLKI